MPYPNGAGECDMPITFKKNIIDMSIYDLSNGQNGLRKEEEHIHVILPMSSRKPNGSVE